MATTSTTSGLEVRLVPAVKADIPELTELNRLAYMYETIAQFAFLKWPEKEDMFNFFKARTAERFNHCKTQVFKAVQAINGKTIGFPCWTLEEPQDKPESGKPVPTPTASVIQQVPAGLNLHFVMTRSADVETLKNHMQGHKHCCQLSLNRARDVQDTLPT
ncbi:MAG: hypothetical protein M1820_007476 [Bogoriella megaspora]|nr:MAG: hypothetical protein M1820_007476 [Bogoriella megaspora]